MWKTRIVGLGLLCLFALVSCGCGTKSARVIEQPVVVPPPEALTDQILLPSICRSYGLNGGLDECRRALELALQQCLADRSAWRQDGDR